MRDINENYYIEKLTPKDKDDLLQECEDIENYFKQFGLSKLLNQLPIKKLKEEYSLFYQALYKLYKNVSIDITFEEFWEDLDSGDIKDGNTYFKWIISIIKDYSNALEKPIDKIVNKEIHNSELGISDYLTQGEQNK